MALHVPPLAMQQPTAHELLQSVFIRGARETYGLESAFDLYWKHRLKKDGQVYSELSGGKESDLSDQNPDEE